MAAMLSGGQSTHQIERDSERETGLSQCFIALNVAALDQNSLADRIADQIIESVRLPNHKSGASVRYPGERVLQTRMESLQQGIPVEESDWDELLKI
jgi:3-dehydro-L-gulonate 2-dehydrogenase